MKPELKPFAIKTVCGVSILLLFLVFSHNAFAANTISGTIFDKARNPLADIDVELLDEYYRVLPNGRQKTTSSGRYEFTGLNAGRYSVRVYAFRYDLQDQTQEIEVAAVSAIPGQPGSSYNVLDFYLQPKKGGLADSELSVIFAQDVPKDAKRLYDTAIDNFSKKKTTDGIMSLVEATKIFPEYYLALQRLTKELFVLHKYVESFQYSRKAAEVNPKSATAYYYMGYSLHNLGKEYDKSSVTALSEAARLAPGSIQVLYVLGKVERSQGKFADAEKHLVAAKKLATAKIPEIYAELSQLYANDLKKYGEAADELEQYIKASKLSDADEKVARDKVADLRAKAKMQTNN
jgi:hypothetical protein